MDAALSDLEDGGQQTYSLSSRRLPFHSFDIGDHSRARKDQAPGRVKKSSLRELYRGERGAGGTTKSNVCYTLKKELGIGSFFSKN